VIAPARGKLVELAQLPVLCWSMLRHKSIALTWTNVSMRWKLARQRSSSKLRAPKL
jgi:hypothetical protein